MTLHWWMHWFWVTLLIITASGGTSSAPQSEELQHITTDTAEQPSVRQGRAMYFSKTQPSTKPTPLPENNTDTPDLHVIPKVNQTNITEIVHPGLQPIEWTAVNATDDTVNVANVSLIDAHILTVNVTANNTVNNTDVAEQNTTFDKRRNLTRPDSVKEATIEGVAESRIVTEKPLSLETTFLQTRIPANIESYRRVVDNDNGMDTGAIAGISFAALVLVALAGSTAFVMYRRRYLNKPQTLNDKCSNPDSSGYLDDSTIRDNSEEMYSLDNDSFLNSLEAMTIQNYWTDTVKHTKL